MFTSGLRHIEIAKHQVVAGQQGADNQMLALVQKSIDNALRFVSENGKTLNDLVEVQHALEAQVTSIQSKGEENLTEEDKAYKDSSERRKNSTTNTKR